MKRVKAGCIFQTLVFSQRPDAGQTVEQARQLNLNEIEHYKASLERTRTRYQVTGQTELEDGSIEIRIRKQYNEKADVSEYFE